jgi:hypothetical protein
MKNTVLNFNKLLLLLLFIGVNAFSQNYAKVDNIVKAYPKSFSDINKLSDKINADFKQDDEKARAIFTWIAINVKYDLAAYNITERPVAYSFRTQEEKLAKERKFKDDLAVKTLKTKKGVCQGYATLFESLAQRVGLEAVIIPGTSKSHPTHIGKQPGASDHAWNAVKIDGQWKLLDVTWGAGTVTGSPLEFAFRFNDGYFLTDPEVFVLNHYPDDEKWLLTKATKADFASFPLYYGNYILGGYEFISPVTGTINNAKATFVPVRIKNLKPGDKVAYAFTKNRIFKEVQLKENAGVAEFDVPVDSSMSGYLTVYINQRSVASYKIK